MEYLIMWSEDMETAFGRKDHFKSIEEFEDRVMLEGEALDGEKRTPINTMIYACIDTVNGIEPDTIMPLAGTDISIENYYITNVAYDE